MTENSNGLENKDTHVFFRETPRRTVIRGEGIYFYDSEGKRYIDGSGGPMVVNIGHGVKEIAEAAKHQMEQLAYIHSMTYLTEPIQKLAHKITSLTPKSLNKVFFVSGGSEGTESAIKLACQYHLERGDPTKHKVISRWMSYHGNTLGALSASGFVYRRKKFQSLLLDFPHIPPAYCYRCWYNKEYPSCELTCAWELERSIQKAGAENISAFIAEPVGGSAIGSVPAPEGYFEIIREICDKYNVLFIADEVQTGFGRTGKMWGSDTMGLKPDAMTVGKAMGGGYPISAAIFTEEVAEAFNDKDPQAWWQPLTFSGNPLGCAAASTVIDIIHTDNVPDKTVKMGRFWTKKFQTQQ